MAIIVILTIILVVLLALQYYTLRYLLKILLYAEAEGLWHVYLYVRDFHAL